MVVDVAIDQGGCFESSRPTTHTHPTYEEEGVIHYCVSNIPGAVARTSTLALTSATLPYVVEIAKSGSMERAAREDEALRRGLATTAGHLTSEPVAQAHSLAYTPPEEVLL